MPTFDLSVLLPTRHFVSSDYQLRLLDSALASHDRPVPLPVEAITTPVADAIVRRRKSAYDESAYSALVVVHLEPRQHVGAQRAWRHRGSLVRGAERKGVVDGGSGTIHPVRRGEAAKGGKEESRHRHRVVEIKIKIK